MRHYPLLASIPLHKWSKWLYRKWKIEKDFQGEVFSYLRNREYYCYHVADIWMSTRLLDWYIIDPQWVQFLIEFKKVTWYSFNMNQFEYSQIELLDLMEERWVLNYIMIYSQKTNTHWVWQYSYLKSNANKTGSIKLFREWIPQEKNQ